MSILHCFVDVTPNFAKFCLLCHNSTSPAALASIFNSVNLPLLLNELQRQQRQLSATTISPDIISSASTSADSAAELKRSQATDNGCTAHVTRMFVQNLFLRLTDMVPNVEMRTGLAAFLNDLRVLFEARYIIPDLL